MKDAVDALVELIKLVHHGTTAGVPQNTVIQNKIVGGTECRFILVVLVGDTFVLEGTNDGSRVQVVEL